MDILNCFINIQLYRRIQELRTFRVTEHSHSVIGIHVWGTIFTSDNAVSFSLLPEVLLNVLMLAPLLLSFHPSSNPHYNMVGVLPKPNVGEELT